MKRTDEMEMLKVEEKHINFSDVSKRWKEIFSQYGNMGMDYIMGAYGTFSNNNPFTQNTRVRNANIRPEYFSEEELTQALKNPEDNEYMLRSMSWWLYYTNFIYQTLVRLNRDVPKYCNYYHPLYIESPDEKKIKADSIYIDRLLKEFGVEETFKTIATQVSVEGKCAYLVRTAFDKKMPHYLTLQKLDSKNIKIVGFNSSQRFTVSFDFNVFLQPGYNIEQYPEFFQKTFTEMCESGIITTDQYGNKKLNVNGKLPKGHNLETKDGRYFYWVKIPAGLCWVFYTDGAHPNLFPDMMGMFPDLSALDDYKWLQGQLASKPVNSIMTGEVPLIGSQNLKAGADMTALSVDVISGYTALWNDLISSNVEAFFAPFENFKLHELENQPEALEVVYSKVRDLIASTGNSALISLSDKPSIAAIRAAEKLKEAATDYLTRQFQNFLNQTLEIYPLNYKWEVKLYGGTFFWDEDIIGVKEMILNGNKGMIPKYLGYYGLSVEDMAGSNQLVDTLDLEFLMAKKQQETDMGTDSAIEIAEVSAKLNPPVVGGTTGTTTTKPKTKSDTPKGVAKVGRPSKEGGDIKNDNTETSKNQGANVSQNK